MKFSLSWLKEHLETDASLGAITDRLTMLGLEVEEVDDRAAAFGAFVIGEVLEAKQHPNADRLRVCMVDAGKGPVQVVCGAPNARTGLKGVFAPSGAYVPGTDLLLKKSSIRGEESNGMLCSEREMGLSDDHDGIIELPADAPVGAVWAEWAGLDDAIIDIGLTPNRGDCASVRGIARDLAAAGLGTLKPLNIDPVTGGVDSPIAWKRDFPADAGDACPYVVGRYFRNVKNGDSPQWLQDRLRAIGLRPISALVDITNWATFDLGRPLHVFDADKVSGDLVMRFARPGEKIAALDGKNYELDDAMMVIADDEAVRGIAGVMGGEASGCGPDTVNVFLEVALFDPIRVAETGRKLGVLSDARYRFERGVDPTSADWGAEIATRMILDLCGGEASALVSAGEMPDWRKSVPLRTSRTLSLGGVDIDADAQEAILTGLGFVTRRDGGVIHADVPPWRPDIDGEADLVEEVLRIHGYDAIPILSLPRESAIPQPVRGAAQKRAEDMRRGLAARGLVEAVTYSFMNEAQAAGFGGVVDSVRLVNPISADLNVMRPSILPNLLAAVARNQARGIEDPALFELGPQYADDTPQGQTLVAAGVRAGAAAPRHWTARSEPVDAFHAKADVMAALAIAGAPVDNLTTDRDVPGWYHPGRAGALRLGKSILACFGEINPRIATSFDVDGPLVGFEIFLDAIPPLRNKGPAKKLLQLSALQPVHRDFAFIVDEAVTAADLLRAVKSGGGALLTEMSLFDVYRGKGVEDGKKSLAIAVTLQPVEATLTDDEIEAIGAGIIASVAKRTGGILRA
jgi:phenylalanyl-tRNA synthetase beta chain